MSVGQHPIEVAINGIGAMIGPTSFALYNKYYGNGNGLNIKIFWGYLAYLQFIGCLEHTNFNLYVLYPFFSTKVIDHNRHHEFFNVNYGGITSFYDKAFGTDYETYIISKEKKN